MDSGKDDLRSAPYRFGADDAFMMPPDGSPDRALDRSLCYWYDSEWRIASPRRISLFIDCKALSPPNLTKEQYSILSSKPKLFQKNKE